MLKLYHTPAGAGEVTNLYSVTYNTNNSTGGTTPATQTAESNSATYTFSAALQNDLVRTDFIFLGWSENVNTTDAQYAPGSTITLNSANPTKTLYAVWDSIAPVNTWDELKYMQQMTTAACNTASGEKTLIDSRDKTTYTVKRLSDNKCWMTQNLRIVDKDITSADSDVTSNYTIPASSAPWSDTAPETNKVHYADNTTYGAYYTWYAATAGTALIGTDAEVKDKNAPSSICPKGWRLPTGGTSGEFQALYNKGKSSWTTNGGVNGYWLGGTGNVAGAAFFPAGGYVYNGSLTGAGSNGYYWSSTANSASYAYYLNFVSTGVNPSNSNNRYRGLSVRCVAR